MNKVVRSTKVLVIGSRGFIGRHISAFLKSKGFTVVNCDIVKDFSKDYFQLKSDMSNISEIFKKHKFEFCINASGAANVGQSFATPSTDFNLNTYNVLLILESIKLNNTACKFVNLSSAAVYGNPKLLPINELADLNPISPYGYHKLFSELICKEYFELFNISTINLRLFSVYGEGLKKQIFWDLHNKVLNSNDGIINVLGNSNDSRDFLYVSDVVQAIFLVINNLDFEGQSINVASGSQIYIGDAVNCFVKLYNKSVDVVFDNNSVAGNPSNWEADITNLVNIGFERKVDLEEGLTNYYNWVIND